MKGFFGGNNRVEGRGEEYPDVNGVVEGDMAGGAKEDKVFECIEIGKLILGDTTASELAELGVEVSLAGVSGTFEDVRVGGQL